MDGFGDLYAAIEDDEAWRALPATIARLCEGRSALVQRLRPFSQAADFLYSHFSDDIIADFFQDFVEHDVWVNAGYRIAGPVVSVAFDEMLAEREVTDSIMFNDLFRRHGDDTGRCVGTMFRGEHETLAVAVHRPLRGKPFVAKDAERVLEAAQHVRRIARARELVDGGRRQLHAAHEAISAMGRAALSVDAELRVLSLSAAASALLRAGDGVMLAQRRLAPSDPQAAAALQRAVREVIGRTASGRPAAFLCRRPSGRRPYRIRVLPNGAQSSDGALVLINDPEAERPDRAQAMGRAYALSPAETALLGSLLSGLSLAETADARGVEVSTLRTQLRAVFAKTDTTRQADLIALMADFPA